MTVQSVQIATSYGDVTQQSSGTIEVTSNSGVHSGRIWTGLRFPGVTVAPGDTITAATLTVITDDTKHDTPSDGVTVWGDPVPNSAAWTGTASEISARAHTSASVSVTGTNLGTEYNLVIDVLAIVQEIAGLSGRNSGDAMSFMLNGTGGEGLTFYSFDGNAAKAPTLSVTYTSAQRVTAQAVGTLNAYVAADRLAGNQELYVYDMTGQKRRQLTLDANFDNWQPRVCPADPTLVMFMETPGGSRDTFGMSADQSASVSASATTMQIHATGSGAWAGLLAPAVPFRAMFEDEMVLVTNVADNGFGLYTLTVTRAVVGAAVTHAQNSRVTSGVNAARLCTIRMDGTGLTRRTGRPSTVNGLDQFTHPEWSSDGREVVILGTTITDAKQVIYRLDTSTAPWSFKAKAVELSNSFSLADPIFSPDGRYIIFAESDSPSVAVSNSEMSITRVDATGTLTSGYQPGRTKLWRMRGVAAAMTTNVTVSNPGTATFDGVTLSNGQTLLLVGQTDQTQNGPYTFNGSGAALTRVSWADTGTEFVGMSMCVRAGTANNNRKWQWESAAPTLGTTNIVFVEMVVATDANQNRGPQSNNLGFAYDPTPTRDSQWIYCEYIANGFTAWDLGRVPLAGGPIETIVGGGVINSRAIPIDDTTMLMHRNMLGTGPDGVFQVWKANLDGTGLTRLSSAAYETSYPSELGHADMVGVPHVELVSPSTPYVPPTPTPTPGGSVSGVIGIDSGYGPGVTFAWSSARWWVKTVERSQSLVRRVRVWVADDTIDVAESRMFGSHQPLGRELPVVMAGPQRGARFTIRFACPNLDSYVALSELAGVSETLLLSGPYGSAHWYCRFVGVSERAALIDPVPQPMRSVALDVVQVEGPTVGL